QDRGVGLDPTRGAVPRTDREAAITEGTAAVRAQDVVTASSMAEEVLTTRTLPDSRTLVDRAPHRLNDRAGSQQEQGAAVGISTSVSLTPSPFPEAIPTETAILPPGTGT
ncbi:hypothetical protein chiPu_0032596, partial [Chiloscyllium punctatum]|nr:hypothetical protein [Chiloscyllium punctatum]